MLTLLAALSFGAAAADKPNVVLIVADDQTYKTVGLMSRGCKVR